MEKNTMILTILFKDHQSAAIPIEFDWKLGDPEGFIISTYAPMPDVKMTRGDYSVKLVRAEGENE